MVKQRIHNEWFFPVAKTKCTSCDSKGSVWGWYEYLNAKKRLVRHFCIKCLPTIKHDLITHIDGCGCIFNFEIRAYTSSVDTIVTALREIEKEINEICLRSG